MVEQEQEFPEWLRDFNTDPIDRVDDFMEQAALAAIDELLHWLLDPKAIDGALRSAYHAHGPISLHGQKIKIWEGSHVPLGLEQYIREITTCGTFSAAKRIRGAMRTRAKEYLRRREERWYGISK